MSELDELRTMLGAVRGQSKSARNVLRSLVPMLAELERLLEAVDANHAEPDWRQSENGTTHETARERAVS